MGRIRTVKPEILEDDRTASLSDSAFRLFVSAILLADDHGNLRADERWLDGQIWWAHGDSRKSAASLRELWGQGLVTVYKVRGQIYMAIRGWKKHQRIDNAGKPRVPTSSDPEAEILPNFAANLRETPLYLRPSEHRNNGTSEHEQEGEHEGEPTQPSAAASVPFCDSEPLAQLKRKVDTYAGDVGRARARKPKPADPTPAELATARRVLARLTERNGVQYRSAEHTRLVVAQLRGGVGEAELRAVIAYCAVDLGWQGDERMERYLQPSTLFGPKNIAKYLDPARTHYASRIASFERDGESQPSLELVPEAG